MLQQIEFTPELLAFLTRQGYTHLLNIGCKSDPSSGNDSDDYFLQPLKPEDQRLVPTETASMIDEIGSADVADMANGESAIRFVIEIPQPDFELFIKA